MTFLVIWIAAPIIAALAQDIWLSIVNPEEDAMHWRPVERRSAASSIRHWDASYPLPV